MRIVSRDELMSMPEGTVYSQWKPCYSSGLFVHGGPCGVDWLEADCLPESDDHGKLFVDDRFGREGMFAHKQQYAVYETEDLHKLARMLGMRVLTPNELKYEKAGNPDWPSQRECDRAE